MCDNTEFPAKPADKLLEKKLPFSPHFLTPAGMLLPKHQQPPPMYGPRGATVPPKFIPKYENVKSQPNFRGASRGGRGHHGNSQQPRRSFNNAEVTLPPRNWDLWCEACDKDFPSKDLLNKHKSEHTTCGIDGCKFVGHPMIVQKHVAQQHETGLYDKLKNVETPEDIKKWREERKRKYPTQQNIELKQKATVARKERGEKLDEPKGKFNHKQNQKQQKQQNRKNNNNRQKKQGGEGQGQVKGRPAQEKRIAVVVDSDEVNQGIPMFRGTRGMWDDEEEEKRIEEEPEKKDVVVTSNPLLALIGMYGDGTDDSEAETEDTVQVPVIVAPTLETNPPPPPPPVILVVAKDIIVAETNANHVQEGEEASSSSSIATEVTKSIQKNPSPGKRKQPQEGEEKKKEPQQQNQDIGMKRKRVLKSGLNYSSLKRTKPNTLLFKLLQGEIRHERNVLLQAVRYVVENNYFDDKDTV